MEPSTFTYVAAVSSIGGRGRIGAILLTILAIAGCGDALPLPIAPDLAPPREPLRHRASAPICPNQRAAYDCQLPMNPNPGGCAADAACVAGTNGRCVGNAHDGCSCSYDTCATDNDCKAGELCACREQWHYGMGGPNHCLPGNCRVDADCGPGGYCSPTLDPLCGAYLGVTGWYCHTVKDECLDDRDCVGFDASFGSPWCGYKQEVGHWACSTAQCVG